MPLPRESSSSHAQKDVFVSSSKLRESFAGPECRHRKVKRQCPKLLRILYFAKAQQPEHQDERNDIHRLRQVIMLEFMGLAWAVPD